jgi:hypothetical protein
MRMHMEVAGLPEWLWLDNRRVLTCQMEIFAEPLEPAII